MERYVAEKVEIGLKMRLGEGPVWQADTNTLSWVDILSGTLHILQATGCLVLKPVNISGLPFLSLRMGSIWQRLPLASI